MKSFSLTYDRHKDKYGFRHSNFKESYNIGESPMEWAKDPDWSVKFVPQRINLKKWMFYAFVVVMMVR